MRSPTKTCLQFQTVCLAALFWFIAVTPQPLRAADTMDEPNATSAQLHYLTGKKPDATTLLAPPPLAGSPEQAADLEEVRAVFHATSSNEVAAALSEKKFNVFNFTPGIGAFFQSNNLPKTAAFFNRVQNDAESITDNAKDFFKRPHPNAADPSLADGKADKSFSYPSGHATESMVLALVLADLFPDRHETIVAHARLMGWHRVQIGRHYPTDVFAGRVLAQAIVKQMEKSDAFQKDLDEVKAEITTAQK
jgi:acid phosphatase (class A)